MTFEQFRTYDQSPASLRAMCSGDYLRFAPAFKQYCVYW